MKFFWFLVVAILNTAMLYTLGTRKFLPLDLGAFLSLQEGVWQNAEHRNHSYDQELAITGLSGKIDVYFDDRLVPHIFAEQEKDAYFVQGYLHASFRLWQMEFQTHAAAGRLSEVVGSKALSFDRNQRRMGMVFSAENALAEMEKDSTTKAVLDAYTAGVNAYIETLKPAQFPIEYKLLGYAPEKWNNLKCALFIKQMTNTLAGYDRDFELTNAYRLLGENDFRLLFPEIPDSLDPIIPIGTEYTEPAQSLTPPADVDSLYYQRNTVITAEEEFKPDPSNGSNNWVVAGSKTKSGKPILSNDPHLGLTLPSIWYELQINTPLYNAYGVSFPGLPGVVIGFNDSIAFGFTNSGRDVKDYFEIEFRDNSKKEYYFNGQWVPSTIRIEAIGVKDSADYLDTVAYTVFGPAMFDHQYQHHLTNNKAYALRWVAHDSSNVMKMWILLNRAKNYADYRTAIGYFNAPGQNMIFASATGDIALWQQGTFPLRWIDQGLFVMPGRDSSYMWKGYIPEDENPHSVNPTQGFLSSANQRPADSTYPYFIPGVYEVYRPFPINRRLTELNSITIEDMKALQNNNENSFAVQAWPILNAYLDRTMIDVEEKKYLEWIQDWSFRNEANDKAVVCFNAWWDSLYTGVFHDELTSKTVPIIKPEKFVLLEALKRDPQYKFVDDIRTPDLEDLTTQVTLAYKKAAKALSVLEKENRITWSVFKNTTIYHLLKTNTLPFARSGIPIGGGHGIVNATQHDHGPSWKMIIEMNSPIQAVGVYPGGQSGNPGSRYYDNFVDTWGKGEYYSLFFMQQQDRNTNQWKWKMTFNAN